MQFWIVTITYIDKWLNGKLLYVYNNLLMCWLLQRKTEVLSYISYKYLRLTYVILGILERI